MNRVFVSVPFNRRWDQSLGQNCARFSDATSSGKKAPPAAAQIPDIGLLIAV
jgi:hypothetical protein